MPGDCLDSEVTAAGSSIASGVDGRIYVTWSSHGVIFFDRSYDDGNTWLTNDLPIAKQQGGWKSNIPGFGIVNHLPSLIMDNGPDRYHGMLYLVYADQRSGAGDTDIWMHRSSMHGDSWTPPTRVNGDEPGKHQFAPAVAVDQTNGSVWVVFYDRRNYDDLQTDVYLAYSRDGGASFKEFKISESPFVASQTKYLEHTGISAHDGLITPIWTRTDEGRASVWTCIVREIVTTLLIVDNKQLTKSRPRDISGLSGKMLSIVPILSGLSIVN